MTQLTALTEAEVYAFKGGGVFIDLYESDENFVTSGATLLSDLDLQETYKAIDSVATGRIPSFILCQ